ncbi:hypothetical protein N2152v2_007410 [Parachlorella kessleri]
MKGDTNSQNTSCFVQVLGVGTDTGVTVPSVLLFFDRQRYLFNVGEGFQRFCVDHKVKLAKVGTVLMTRVTTEASGGLPGMLITMADTSCGGLLAGHDSMTLHGPKGLTTLVNAFRTFVNVKDIGLQVREFDDSAPAAVPAGGADADGNGAAGNAAASPSPVVQNEVVTITPVVIRAAPRAAGAGSAATPVAEAAPEAAEAAAVVEPEAKRPRLDVDASAAAAPAGNGSGSGALMPSVSVESPAACYVCELPPIPGKFLPKKAAQLGVPSGPLYGKLARGETVTTAGGKVVTPEEVMEPSTPGPVILVVDCPSQEFVEGLVSAPALARWAHPENRDKVACVVHLGERGVTRLPAYRAWLASFGGGTTHMLVGESQGTGVPTVKGFATLQARLNTLDAALFPLMHLGDAVGGEAGAGLGERSVVGANMLRYHLRPLKQKGLDSKEVSPAFDAVAVQQQFREKKPEVLKSLEAAPAPAPAAAAPAVPPCVASGQREQVEVTFLGTGGAIPSKYRNVTSIFVNLFERGCLLMDAGEGTYSQLRRRFGPAQADEYIKRLGCLWISHIHADHHVGLPTLLAARTRLLGQDCTPLLVLGPRPLRRCLQVYAQLEPMRFLFLEAANSAEPSPDADGQVSDEGRAAVEAVRQRLALSRFESVRVRHCRHAYGLCLEGPSDAEADRRWKVVFSADTRPCEALVEAAKGATIFIHEATFDDSLVEEAVAKNHSTIGEAVEAGAAAGAYLLMLTHFSQRYPKVPVINHEAMQGNVGIAYDLMSLNLADLPRVPRLLPALTAMFAEEVTADGEEAAEQQ